ncbi:hypothetical protein DBR11_11860 [Pedobacter sp. HMWF019]|uniref:hypothetical protein n=1 Tax=Pedobacter sp. HMWF019 TaxID=2056856 RepID=UPI000D378551|nr:hypothetical protein [Pedobacter sp. HMWF019]PTS99676.1 hypothetical protein DBR11_11860 [Pedobacter sp. HMWF019]
MKTQEVKNNNFNAGELPVSSARGPLKSHEDKREHNIDNNISIKETREGKQVESHPDHDDDGTPFCNMD